VREEGEGEEEEEEVVEERATVSTESSSEGEGGEEGGKGVDNAVIWFNWERAANGGEGIQLEVRVRWMKYNILLHAGPPLDTMYH
jgi:hypothetical protein